MLYLLDANVLITAHTLYYPLNKVEEFWGWLHYQAAKGLVKMPIEIFEEIKDGPDDGDKDLLYGWIQQKDVRDALVLHGNEVDPALVQKVTDEGYKKGLTDTELEKIGRDPFLIAHAMSGADRMVISTEVSKPKRQGANRKVPDVCAHFGVPCKDPFFFYRALVLLCQKIIIHSVGCNMGIARGERSAESRVGSAGSGATLGRGAVRAGLPRGM